MRRWVPFRRGAIAGLVSLALGFALRIGGFAPFPPESAIELFIKYIPASLEQPAIQSLGDNAIRVGLLVASIVAALGYGIFGVFFEDIFASRIDSISTLSQFEKFLAYAFVPWAFFGFVFLPLTGVGVFGVSSPNGTLLYVLTLLLTQAVFCWVLSWEYRGEPDFFSKIVRRGVGSMDTKRRMSRRSFIEKGVLAGTAALLALLSLDSLLSFFGAGGISEAIRPGQPHDLASAPPIFEDPRLASLVNSEITDNASFYRVDIDLTPPIVNASSWSLNLMGTVSPKTYSLAELQRLPQVEEFTTFECVSNTVNGNLLSTAKWTGVRLIDLFQDAGGLPSSAVYVVFSSEDNYSVGIPVSKATMPDSILAYKMNDADLPAEHGYPLRAVIPGLYGMMSAKWITRIQVLASGFVGYWQSRGYTKDATINTLAFLRVPADNAVVSLSKNNGSVLLGGYAFAGDRGISKVEISVDGGRTWQQAELKQPISNLTWTLWALDWHPESAGVYQVYARATDGNLAPQTPTANPPYPNGATGYAMITVNVTN